MNTRKIEFQTDGYHLHGTLHLPDPGVDPAAMPLVVGSHGLLSDGESPKQKTLADRLNQQGIAFFRFDHRGRGNSDGQFAEASTFEGRTNDMAAAIRAARSGSGAGGPLGVFGSSMGGAVCIGIADRFDISAMVTLAAPLRIQAISVPPDIAEDPLFRDMAPEQLAFDVSEKLRFVQTILVFHGDGDDVVAFENALEIHDKATDPKKLVRFAGGDHAISDPECQKQFIDQSVEWFLLHLRP